MSGTVVCCFSSGLLIGVKCEYANTVALTYDAGGRKATEALTIAGQTYSVGTAYDAAGRVSQLTQPDGTLVGRAYDSRNLLSTIAYAGGIIDTRTYDAGGRLSSETLGNGQVVTRAYLTGDNLPALIANAAVGNYRYGWEASPRRRPSREERGEDAVASLTDKTSETITEVIKGVRNRCLLFLLWSTHRRQV